MRFTLCLLVTLTMACATAGTKEPPDDDPDTGVVPDPPDAQPMGDAPGPADAPCTDMVEELLQNPGFENGDDGAWQKQSPYNLIRTGGDLPVAAQGGAYAVWLGGNNSLSEALWQDVDVPSGTKSLELSGYRWIDSNEPNPTPLDSSQVTLRSMAGDLLENAGHWSNADEMSGWVQFSFTAAESYEGLAIRFQVESATDSLYPTSFLYDTLSLRATVCR